MSGGWHRRMLLALGLFFSGRRGAGGWGEVCLGVERVSTRRGAVGRTGCRREVPG